jgi:cytoskeletal protein CcmA (bactofilin family)
MDTLAYIGPTIRIKGELSASEPITIAGRVDGTVAVEGHSVTIAERAQVTAQVTADAIIVAGTVHGRLTAATRIVVRNTAAVDGDLSAPTVSLAEGAAVHGRIETRPRKSGLALAS